MQELDTARSTAEQLVNNVKKVMIGKDTAIELGVIALMCRGHVLIEDVPGVGKTMLARSIAKSAGCTFKRIQFTPALLPLKNIRTESQGDGLPAIYSPTAWYSF